MANFKKIPLLGRVASWFDKQVEKGGLQGAAQVLATKLNAKIEICIPQQSISILETGPVLVVANHPFDSEWGPLLCALPKRPDIFIISSIRVTMAGSNVSKQIIPVHTKSFVESKKLSAILHRLSGKKHTVTAREVYTVNTKALATALEKLNDGSLVIVFPQGADSSERWQHGLGRLLKAAGSQNIHVLFAHIGGTSNWDWLRFIPIVGKLFPSFKVTFSTPIAVNTIDTALSAGVVTKNMHEAYNRWRHEWLQSV